MHELPVVASQQRLHAFCRAHGWRVETVRPDGARRPVNNWMSCRSRIVELRLGPDADRCLLRARDMNGRGAAAAAIDLDRPLAARDASEDLEHGVAASPVTPRLLFLPSRALEQRAVIAAARAAQAGAITCEIAYSIKTNPSDDALGFALASGCLAEAVSQLEISRALAAGFSAEQIVLNGPAKWWPRRIELAPLRALFCDSMTELADTLARVRGGAQPAMVIGIRLRPPRLSSRFGVPVTTGEEIAALAAQLADLPRHVELGLHFHVASSEIGVADWFELCRWMVLRAAALQEASGTPVRCLDLGGGWYPEDFVGHLLPALPGIAAMARERLAGLATIVLEPGRAVVQPMTALLTRVVGLREHGSGREIIVDASISEVVDAGRFPHPVLIRDGVRSVWSPLGEGLDRVAGRSCMESDIIAAGLQLPADVSPGDLVAIDQVGAYDTSKSYVFGCG